MLQKLRGSDCSGMREALKKSYENKADFDRVGLYGEVLRLAAKLESVEFGYVSRRKNKMAHGLSRVGSMKMEPVEDSYLIEICSDMVVSRITSW